MHRVEQLFELKVLGNKKAPSHMTNRRMLQDTISPEEFEQVLQEYHQNRIEDRLEIVLSMDGKTLKGTIPGGEMRGTHLLSIYVPDQGLVLAEVEVDRKENEIVAASVRLFVA
jgi:hypothetical protein